MGSSGGDHAETPTGCHKRGAQKLSRGRVTSRPLPLSLGHRVAVLLHLALAWKSFFHADGGKKETSETADKDIWSRLTALNNNVRPIPTFPEQEGMLRVQVQWGF